MSQSSPHHHGGHNQRIAADPQRRRVLKVLGGVAGLSSLAPAAVLSACSDGVGASPLAPSSLTAAVAGAPALGAHNLAFNRDGVVVAPLSTAAMNTHASGSTMLVCVGRGVISAHGLPTDTFGNVYSPIGAPHPYALWPYSGTALYACQAAQGGTGHQVTVPKPVGSDETTLTAVEIVDGGSLLDAKWKEVAAGLPLTSPVITTTGPALLVAWWWGDADVRFDKTAVPDSGFTVIDSILLQGALVQCAVAVRQVDTAGSYSVTWTATPVQGAQLWIAAVQASTTTTLPAAPRNLRITPPPGA